MWVMTRSRGSARVDRGFCRQVERKVTELGRCPVWDKLSQEMEEAGQRGSLWTSTQGPPGHRGRGRGVERDRSTCDATQNGVGLGGTQPGGGHTAV